jgi:gluconolactonase
LKVICVDPREGRLVQQVALPAAQVTSVCWGGRLLDQLFVTTAAVRGEEAKPAAGRLFRVAGLNAHGLLNDQTLLPSALQHLAP